MEGVDLFRSDGTLNLIHIWKYWWRPWYQFTVLVYFYNIVISRLLEPLTILWVGSLPWLQKITIIFLIHMLGYIFALIHDHTFFPNCIEEHRQKLGTIFWTMQTLFFHAKFVLNTSMWWPCFQWKNIHILPKGNTISLPNGNIQRWDAIGWNPRWLQRYLHPKSWSLILFHIGIDTLETLIWSSLWSQLLLYWFQCRKTLIGKGRGDINQII